MAGVPGIDVSFWQGIINWPQVVEAGYRFVFIRATMGTKATDVDERFFLNWNGAKAAGLLVSAYHLVKPDLPAADQIERFLLTMGDLKADLPLALDVELTKDQPAGTITACLKECARLIQESTGRAPVIYTRASFWDPNVHAAPDWGGCDLWVAHYGVSSPTLPRDWASWRFWQHSEKGSVPGSGSPNTDLNWFNGTEDDLRAYAGATEPGATLVRPPKPAAGMRARVTVPELRVRSGPGIHHAHIGDLKQGDEITITAIQGDEVWVQIEPGKWAALCFQGVTHINLD